MFRRYGVPPNTKSYIVLIVFISYGLITTGYPIPNGIDFAIFLMLAALSYSIRCPVCSKPVLVRRRPFLYALPWPESICSKCGANLRLTDGWRARPAMNHEFLGLFAALLSIGVCGLFRWLPLRTQRVVIANASQNKSRRDYLFGAVGTFCFATQMAMLWIVGIEFPSNATLLVRLCADATVAIPVILFGVGAFNFVEALLLRSRA